jgi:hypothetical protein
MTEAEWLACTFSTRMFELLRKKARGSHRKRLLLGLECCRRVMHLMSAHGRRAVEVAERFGEGRATEAERWDAFEAAGTAMDEAADLRTHKADWCAYRVVQLPGEEGRPASWDDDLAAMIAQTVPEAFAWTGTAWDAATLTTHRADMAHLVRDVFGNPFRRSHPLSPRVLAWNDATVPRLAQAIYDDRAFDRLPLLADALLDAGCDYEELVRHCRSEGPHVRGCWAVDLALAKD